jgi:hypothetical protein
MPFSTSFRRGADQPRDLIARIDVQIQERIEEAVDFVCLERMVTGRRARALPAPAADSARDREEFDASVRAFLEHLQTEIGRDLPAEASRRVAGAGGTGGDGVTPLLAVQVALAKLIPDYWQRFDRARAGYLADVPTPGDAGSGAPSGGPGSAQPPVTTRGAPAGWSRREGRSLLARLFGHG